MLKKRHKPELIVTKLRQVDVLISQGQGNCLASVRSAWAGPRQLGLCRRPCVYRKPYPH